MSNKQTPNTLHPHNVKSQDFFMLKRQCLPNFISIKMYWEIMCIVKYVGFVPCSVFFEL